LPLTGPTEEVRVLAFREYADFDALGLAELVARGEVSAAELVDEAIDRAERHNPKLNALVFAMYDSARDAARKADAERDPAPFRGVPFLLKDLLGNYAGVPTTCASRFLAGVPANHDSELVLRFRRAGLIPIGKTNCSEFGLLPTTEPQLHGTCRNPWNTDRSSGGSSGGSAAAVAAGIVPVAHASDGGGSIRIPASCCGLVGMKPTRARNTLAPLIGDIMSGLVVEHAVSRSVRDSAAILDCTAGPGIGDPYTAPPPERPYLEEVSRDPGRLRLATWSQNIRGGAIDSECREAVEKTAALLVDLGHDVEQAAPPIDADMIADAFFTIWTAGATATIDLMQLSAGRVATPEFFEPLTWALYERGREISASDYQRAVALSQLASRQIAAFFETYDAWFTPTLEKPPLPLGQLDGRETDIEKAFAPIFEYATYTPIFNSTGQPAISLPLHWTADGLPVGVQLAGRFGDEGLLFRLAAQLETARPWIERKPPIWD
jgi:amidase